MFFWFFKQLYYNLKRITKHKSIILFVFFVLALLLFHNFCNASSDVPQIVIDTALNTAYGNNIVIKNTDTNKYFIIYSVVDNSYSSETVFKLTNNNWVFSYPDNNNNYIYINDATTLIGVITYDANTDTLSNPVNTENYGFAIPQNITIIPVWSKYNILYKNYNGQANGSVYFYSNYTPYIVTNSNDIINFSFSYLTINAGINSFNDSYKMIYTYPDVNNSWEGNINNFKYLENGNLIFKIPRSWFTQDIVVRSGSRISFDIIRTHIVGAGTIQEFRYSLGSYILDLTAQEQQEINEDSDKQLLSDINKNQQDTTQAIDNLNNSLTDDNVEFNDIDLPTDNSEDITQDGVNNIFTSIYNAFCTGQPQDIIFPIPFTNKNITLQPNYVRDMLTNNGASWVVTIIETFWGYLIGRFIIKDIVNKINKIKSGNIEAIEQNNIKGDML